MNPVKNITISDAKTGFVLLERKFRWPTNTTSSNLGSLTQSFYQFAREVDDGFIGSVVFEGKEREPHWSGNGGSGGSGRSSKQIQTMQMVCTRNEYETVSIFYDTTNYVVDAVDSNNLLLAIEESFADECGDVLSRLSARIMKLVDCIEENSAEVSDIRNQFEFFAQHVDRIILAAFPPSALQPPPPPSNQSSSSELREEGGSREGSRRRSNNSSRSRSSRGSSRSGLGSSRKA